VLLQDYGSDWHGARIREGLQVLERAQANTAYADGHAAPASAFSLSTNLGRYSASVTQSGATGTLSVAGTTEYGSAYLYGSFGKRSGLEADSELAVELYGTVYSDGGTYNVSRAFTFSGNADLEPVVRQIAEWVESILAG
jgi:prepilin-type processing-associated H-X9-DG protein